MNKTEEKIFLASAKMGIACGLWHPFEWYTNSIIALDHGPWNEILKRDDEITNAYISFLRECDSMPNDPIKNLTRKEFIEMINNYYYKESK